MTSPIKNTADLFELVKILGQQTDFQEVLRLIAHHSAQWLKADLTLILMLNPHTRETVKTMIKEGRTVEQKRYRDIHIHVGGWIIANRQPFLSLNLQRDERFMKGLFDRVPIRSVAGVPLIIEGIIIGALILLYQETTDINQQITIEPLENLAALAVPFLRNTQKIREYFDSSLPQASLLEKYKNAGLFGKSPRFIELLQTVEAATRCDARVLLVGKTGTGKELIAKAIHRFSSRESGPFVAIDCGAIPPTLLESEFFGHTKGAYTGAHSERQGLFLKAIGGTLFMDEINNLPYDMQSKLLRVIEEGEVRPVGSDQFIKADIRIIAASSTSLKELLAENKFREDLFFRLHVYPIYIPDLNERIEDIPLLAEYFLLQYVKKQDKKASHFHEEVIDFMKQRRWDGHIRELENFVERIVTVTPVDAKIIDPAFFPGELQQELQDYRLKINNRMKAAPLKDQLNKHEAEIIRKALIECGWNQSQAARKLQTSESNIRYKMSQFKIHRDE